MMVKTRAAIGSWAGLGYRPGRDDTWHSRHMIVRYSCCRGEAGQVAAAAQGWQKEQEEEEVLGGKCYCKLYKNSMFNYDYRILHSYFKWALILVHSGTLLYISWHFHKGL